jgi:hypothetical protein
LKATAVVKAFFLCSLIVLVCVGYVWQKQQINLLGDQIRAGESRLARLRDQNDKLRKTVAELVSPAALDIQVQKLGLGLVPPQQSQIWRLPEPRVAPPAPHAGLFAVRQNPGARESLK